MVSYEPMQATAELSDAGVIVTGGDGLRTRENYDAYIRPLAGRWASSWGWRAWSAPRGPPWSAA